MMLSETINITTRSQSYDKTEEKKIEKPSPDKGPCTSSTASSSNGPLTTEKPNIDMILCLPKSTLKKVVFNPNA